MNERPERLLQNLPHRQKNAKARAGNNMDTKKRRRLDA
jgi:hypothetical protein